MKAIPVKNVKDLLYITYSGALIDLSKTKGYEYLGTPEYGLIIKASEKNNNEDRNNQ